MQKVIRSVFGAEPRREDEQPSSIIVGFREVHRIEEENENLGTYGITWFVGYTHQGQKVAKMNALHVETVSYGNAI